MRFYNKFFMSLSETHLLYLHSKCVRQSWWHGIANHLIPVSDVCIEEHEAIRKCLYSCAFTHTQPTIKVLISFCENSLVRTDISHFWSLRMLRLISCLCLYCERLFVPWNGHDCATCILRHSFLYKRHGSFLQDVLSESSRR